MSRNSTCMSRTTTPLSCAIASPIRSTPKFSDRVSSRRLNASSSRGDAVPLPTRREGDLLPPQLLPHLADFGPGIVPQNLFQIEHGELVAGGGARQRLP